MDAWDRREGMGRFRVAVWGATGLTGGELLRLVAGHPGMELACAVSRGRAGQPLGGTHPHLRHAYPSRAFVSPEEGRETQADLAFLALPHGASAEEAARCLAQGQKVVDLSADFRLGDPEAHRRWYGAEAPEPGLRGRRVYGLPELHREALRGADLVSGVGCNATAAILALLPLARAGVLEEARVECRVGSSEGGASGDEGSHHPWRSRALRVVTPFAHRHLGELCQELGLEEERLTLGVTAVELVRGVQCLVHGTLSRPMGESDLWRLYRGAYGGEPFVDLCPARPAHQRIPDPRHVLGSNRVRVGFALAEGGRRILAASALDNLMKGAAGTAVQGANLALGLPETRGLDMLPVFPA